MSQHNKETGRKLGGRNISKEQYKYLLRSFVLQSVELGYGEGMLNSKGHMKGREVDFSCFLNHIGEI